MLHRRNCSFVAQLWVSNMCIKAIVAHAWNASIHHAEFTGNFSRCVAPIFGGTVSQTRLAPTRICESTQRAIPTRRQAFRKFPVVIHVVGFPVWWLKNFVGANSYVSFNLEDVSLHNLTCYSLKWLPLLTSTADVDSTFKQMQSQGVKVVRTWVS